MGHKEETSESEEVDSGDGDSMRVLNGSWESDDSVSMLLESVSLDEDSAMDSVMTRTMVERNTRNIPQTIDTKQEVEMVQVEHDTKNKTTNSPSCI